MTIPIPYTQRWEDIFEVIRGGGEVRVFDRVSGLEYVVTAFNRATNLAVSLAIPYKLVSQSPWLAESFHPGFGPKDMAYTITRAAARYSWERVDL